MADWSHLLGPLGRTLGTPAPVRAFAPTEPPLDERARADGDALLIEGDQETLLQSLVRRFFNPGQGVRLYEVQNPGTESGLLLYRARLRAEGLQGRASLEMWCRFPGRVEFFSKGAPMGQSVEGSTDWTDLEIPFLVRKGEIPDLVRLNVVVEGAGKVRLRDVELLYAPFVASGEVAPAAAPEGRGDEAAPT
jgi:hypothetical protein